MAPSDKTTTVVSTKGQVILPKRIREQTHWTAGTRLTIETTDEGVLLKRAPAFAATRPATVFGSLRVHGAPKTLAEMKAGIEAEARQRHARARY